MIRFRLNCSKGHEFEAWFRSGEDFDRQVARKLLACPQCGDAEIAKAVMAPAVARRDRDPAVSQTVAAPAPAAAPAPQMTKGLPLPGEVVEVLRKLRDHVRQNADYVGDRFAEEARKIHYEEIDPRGIYGEATVEEAEALREEGIEFHPLPVLPEDTN
ncbi:MAG: DUF1178 family protein [Hyphomicrobiaceae bacterium]